MHEDELRTDLNVYYKDKDNYMHSNCVIKTVRGTKHPKKNRVTIRYRDERLGKSRNNRIQEIRVALSSLYILRFPENDREKKAQMEEEEQVAAAGAAAHKKEMIQRRKLAEAVGAADILTGEDDKGEPAVSL